MHTNDNKSIIEEKMGSMPGIDSGVHAREGCTHVQQCSQVFINVHVQNNLL